mmetsp:Transcript_78906/g.223302  ORF Transcript_78906/g.223302 Transcript_78906/m.223302 type:complete len:248 (+) Transcript_78906:74-817(+)|eukprot:CAMPEP_0179268480 /NCGR_PEP_ID=MMETSP0797-20121207/30464_1 /TAXON_ID=47934 /ORGANISM="Dinophysis acuminata, Strain DAEP01" /LENGTH=247 /DNA_ID=CAMNT_0020976767 /DNA_START=73 /DNA_END=816 /DNA_ORIENTATION=+
MVVGATASTIARRQAGGDAAASLLNPQGPVLVRNHARENLRAMREKERQLRGRKIMESQAPPAEFKLRQFAGARSRVYDAKGSHAPPAGGRAAESEGEEMDMDAFEARCEELKRKHGQQQQPPPQGGSGSGGDHPDRCLAYLQKLSGANAGAPAAEPREQRVGTAAAEVAAKRPAELGPRRLSPEEVAERLSGLKRNREAIEADFRRLPLMIETDSQKRRQAAVMAKIEESDRAMKLLSQPVVYADA